jgi:hypothetical protein
MNTQTHGGDAAGHKNNSKSHDLLIRIEYGWADSWRGDPAGEEDGSKSNGLLITIWNKLIHK